MNGNITVATALNMLRGTLTLLAAGSPHRANIESVANNAIQVLAVVMQRQQDELDRLRAEVNALKSVP